jgi:biotin carboxylase
MPPRMFHRLFIANRGEVAVRVARACDALGITPVFGVSEADREAPYTRGREVVVLGPARAAGSYLDPVRVVQAARQSSRSGTRRKIAFDTASFAASLSITRARARAASARMPSSPS